MSKNKISIRYASKNDVPNLVSLRKLQQSGDWGNEYVDSPEFPLVTSNFLYCHLGADLNIVLIESDEGEVISLCGVQELNLLPQCNDNGNIGFICFAYTKENYRNKGYISLVIDEIIRFSKENNFCELWLETDNSYMVSTLKKKGFRENNYSMVLYLDRDYKTFKEWIEDKVVK